jgi:hypothetical protein
MDEVVRFEWMVARLVSTVDVNMIVMINQMAVLNADVEWDFDLTITIINLASVR